MISDIVQSGRKIFPTVNIIILIKAKIENVIQTTSVVNYHMVHANLNK